MNVHVDFGKNTRRASHNGPNRAQGVDTVERSIQIGSVAYGRLRTYPLLEASGKYKGVAATHELSQPSGERMAARNILGAISSVTFAEDDKGAMISGSKSVEEKPAMLKS